MKTSQQFKHDLKKVRLPWHWHTTKQGDTDSITQRSVNTSALYIPNLGGDSSKVKPYVHTHTCFPSLC